MRSICLRRDSGSRYPARLCELARSISALRADFPAHFGMATAVPNCRSARCPPRRNHDRADAAEHRSDGAASVGVVSMGDRCGLAGMLSFICVAARREGARVGAAIRAHPDCTRPCPRLGCLCSRPRRGRWALDCTAGTGYRALDAIRAMLAFAPLGLNPSTPIGLWGYSGGGLTTAWTAEMASGYAPELKLVGAVAGSPAGDPGSMFLYLNGSSSPVWSSSRRPRFGASTRNGSGDS